MGKDLIVTPFHKDVFHCEVESNLAISDILYKTKIPYPVWDAVVVTLNGVEILRTHWETVHVQEADSIAIFVIPMGGGSKEILRLVAVLAVAIAAPYIAAGLTGVEVGALTVGGKILAGGITLVGTLAINALIPPPRLPGQTESSIGNSYFLSSQSGNRARYYETIPIVYGIHKMLANLATTVDVFNAGNSSIFSACYDFGLGGVTLSQIKAADTDLTVFGGKIRQLKRVPPLIDPIKPDLGLQAVILQLVNFPVKSVDVSIGLNEDLDEGTVQTAINTSSAVVEILFPSGLVNFDLDGEERFRAVNYDIQYRGLNSGDLSWHSIPAGSRGYAGDHFVFSMGTYMDDTGGIDDSIPTGRLGLTWSNDIIFAIQGDVPTVRVRFSTPAYFTDPGTFILYNTDTQTPMDPADGTISSVSIITLGFIYEFDINLSPTFIGRYHIRFDASNIYNAETFGSPYPSKTHVSLAYRADMTATSIPDNSVGIPLCRYDPSPTNATWLEFVSESTYPYLSGYTIDGDTIVMYIDGNSEPVSLTDLSRYKGEFINADEKWSGDGVNYQREIYALIECPDSVPVDPTPPPGDKPIDPLSVESGVLLNTQFPSFPEEPFIDPGIVTSTAFSIGGNKAQTGIVSIVIPFPYPRQWEIRIVRVSASSESNRVIDSSTWTRLNSRGPSIDSDPRTMLNLKKQHTLMEVQFEASENIQGNVQQISALAHGEIRTSIGGVWQPATITRNPAWVVLDILTGYSIQNHQDVPVDHLFDGGWIKDGQINFAEFETFAAHCDEDVSYYDAAMYGDWAVGSTSDIDAPADQQWNNNFINTLLRISVNDLNGTDRLAELMALPVGGKIAFHQGSSKKTFIIQSSPTNGGITWVDISVTVLSASGSFSVGQPSLMIGSDGDLHHRDRYCFDNILSSSQPIIETCQSILSMCRSQLIIDQSGKFSILRDQIQSTPRQLFTPQNSWGFKGSRTFMEVPHAFHVQFTSPELGYNQSTTTVYRPGYNAANSRVFENLPTFGVTNWHQASQYGLYMLAQGVVRNETFSLNTDVENLVVQRGDLVHIQHDVPLTGGSANIIKESSTGTQIVVNQIPPLFSAPIGYTLRDQNGNITYGNVNSIVDNVITTDIAVNVTQGDLIVVGTKKGDDQVVTDPYIITKVVPKADLSAELTLVKYDEDVHSVDWGGFPIWNPSYGDTGYEGTSLYINIILATAGIVYQNRYPFSTTNLTWTLEPSTLADSCAGFIIGFKKDDHAETIKLIQLSGADRSWEHVYDTDNLELGTGTYTIVPLSNLGFKGKSASIHVGHLTDTQAPATPVNFVADWFIDNVTTLTWAANTEVDLDKYEIYVADTDVGVELATYLGSANHSETTFTTLEQEQKFFYIVAIDTSKNRSIAAKVSSIFDDTTSWDNTFLTYTIRFIYQNRYPFNDIAFSFIYGIDKALIEFIEIIQEDADGNFHNYGLFPPPDPHQSIGILIDLLNEIPKLTGFWHCTSIDFNGLRGSTITKEVITVQDTDAPRTVDTVAAQITGSTIQLSWPQSRSRDVDGYIVYHSPDVDFVGEPRDDARPIGRTAWNVTSMTVPSIAGSYMVVVVDTSGNESEEQIAYPVEEVIAEADLLGQVDEQPTGWIGTKVNMIVDGNDLITTGTPQPGTFDTFPILRCSYTPTTTTDLGSIRSFRVVSLFKATSGYSKKWAAWREYRTSKDNITWSEWKPAFVANDYARFIEFRLIANVYETGAIVRFSSDLTNIVSIVDLDSYIGESFPSGLYDGGELNIVNGGANIEIIDGAGVIIDSYTNPLTTPTKTKLSWLTQDQVINTPSTAGRSCWFTIIDGNVDGPIPGTNLGVLLERSVRPTPAQERDEIFIGFAIHNGSEWGEVSSPTVVNSTAHSLNEYIKSLDAFTHIQSGGQINEAIGFKMDQEAGIYWELNRNWHVNRKDPNREAFPERLNFQWRYVNQDFSTVVPLNNIVDPTQWDNNGVVETITGAAGRSTIQRLFVDPRDNYWVLYGQNLHDSYAEAIASIGNDTTQTEIPPLLSGAILIGYIISEHVQSDWQEEHAAFFANGGASGGGGGGSTSPTESYDDLIDTPSNKTGEALKFVRVNSDETALEYANPSVIEHGILSGLLVDDHLQYHTDGRGDVRYTPLGHISNHSNPHQVTYSQLPDKPFIPPAQTFQHGDLIDVTPDQHHNQQHTWDGSDHTGMPSEFPPSPHDHVDFGGAGSRGFVPDSITETGKVLSDDGTWISLAIIPPAGIKFPYKFSTATSVSSPTPGYVKINNSNANLATLVSINNITQNGNSAQLWFDGLQEGDFFGLLDGVTGAHYYYKVNGQPLDNSTWFTIPVEPYLISGTILNNADCDTFLVGNPENRLPEGGEENQVLAKSSAVNYHTKWMDVYSKDEADTLYHWRASGDYIINTNPLGVIIGRSASLGGLLTIGDYADIVRNTDGWIYRHVRGDGSQAMGLYATGHPSPSMAVYVNNIERMRILSDGKVGIGTPLPTRNFVVGGGATAGAIKLQSFSSTAYIYAETTDATAKVDLTIDALSTRFLTNGSERMRIDSAGNVGIGITNPSAKLHVKTSLTDILTLERNGILHTFKDIFGLLTLNTPSVFNLQVDGTTQLNISTDGLVVGTGVGGPQGFGSINVADNYYVNGQPIESFVDAPLDGNIYGRRDAAWVEVAVGGGGTISDLALTRNSTVNTITNTGGDNVTLFAATTSLAGVMLASDKGKLDGVANNANNYVHPAHTARNVSTSGLEIIGSFTSNSQGHVTGITTRTLDVPEYSIGDETLTVDGVTATGTIKRIVNGDMVTLIGRLSWATGGSGTSAVRIRGLTHTPAHNTGGMMNVSNVRNTSANATGIGWHTVLGFNYLQLNAPNAQGNINAVQYNHLDNNGYIDINLSYIKT